MKQLNYRLFITGCILSLMVAGILFYLTYLKGMAQAFLILNGDGGRIADNLFRFFTYFGDVLLWIPFFAFVIITRRKLFLPLAIGSFFFTTLFTQVCKLLIMPGQPRPLKAITDGSFIHTVEGVTIKIVASFPSSHTATAFTFFLMLALITPRKWWLPVGFSTAVLVGYSRIYLAQHFPLDVAAGIVVSIISVSLAIPFQKWIDNHYRSLDSIKG